MYIANVSGFVFPLFFQERAHCRAVATILEEVCPQAQRAAAHASQKELSRVKQRDLEGITVGAYDNKDLEDDYKYHGFYDYGRNKNDYCP